MKIVYLIDDVCWGVVIECDLYVDGVFFYGVCMIGVFCCLICVLW